MVRKLLLWSWCLPQSLLGLLVYSYFKLFDRTTVRAEFKEVMIVLNSSISCSLGRYIFITNIREKSLLHEYGHTMQGYIFGPLYLPMVGLPSLIFAVISLKNKEFAKRYFERYPEKWADRLVNNAD
jgi:hypothetical protein